MNTKQQEKAGIVLERNVYFNYSKKYINDTRKRVIFE